MICLNCSRRQSARGRRGLCRVCHKRPDIRARFPQLIRRRDWTGLERLQLIRLRDAGASFPRCAELLRRSYHQVKTAWYRFGLPTQARRPRRVTYAAIRRFAGLGWTDGEMARETGLSRNVIGNYRREIGLRANVTTDESLVRCFGCDRPCPSGKQVKCSPGWKSKEVELGITLIICPSCFASHGWGTREGVAC